MPSVRLILFLLAGTLSAEFVHAVADRPYGVVPAKPQLESAATGQNLQAETPLADHVILVGSSPSFELEFADVRDHTGAGFDHPQLGIDRRAIAVAVLSGLVKSWTVSRAWRESGLTAAAPG